MNLSANDLQAISDLMDKKLSAVNEFVKFAEPAIQALLDESQSNFENRLPKRVENLEKIHPQSQHSI